MVVLRFESCSKNGVKFLLRKHSTHRFYGFRTGETLAHLQQLHRMSNTLHLVIRFRPTVSLPDSPCAMSIPSWEPEILLAIDRSSPSPAQQTYNAWNQRVSEKFFLIFGYVLIITVGHRPNSEQNLPRAEQFNKQADTVAGLLASVMKGVVKRWAWQ